MKEVSASILHGPTTFRWARSSRSEKDEHRVTPTMTTMAAAPKSDSKRMECKPLNNNETYGQAPVGDVFRVLQMQIILIYNTTVEALEGRSNSCTYASAMR
jgi:hypothetical protein